ncbi:hypothetical protein [Bacillus benzoevorans]|uniref:Uncharacterized protein n=1 Tax=Bacillus benzoevorans TaxID=1456 RepID=A0A7X0LWH0_9BACI|nr:hypothetical protein [Bacillus benzoevorans]MBB6446650.1 hypothetical protein [Bacillus benzoevorans]
MYYIMYGKEDIICENFDLVMDKIVEGWKLYGYSDSKQLAESLLHECEHY